MWWIVQMRQWRSDEIKRVDMKKTVPMVLSGRFFIGGLVTLLTNVHAFNCSHVHVNQ